MLNYSHTWLNENSKINMICPMITSQHGHLQQNMAKTDKDVNITEGHPDPG